MGQRLIRTGRRSKGKERRNRGRQIQEQIAGLNSRFELIQLLIPLGLKAVEEELQTEVEQLVGHGVKRNPENWRWGRNPGSVYLGDQKVKMEVPRVRNVTARQEVPLESYQAFRKTTVLDDRVLNRLICGISTRQYEQAAACVPETFGIKKSSISRHFIRTTARRLETFLNRDLSRHDIVAIFIDGKRLAETDMIVALGITMEGEKLLLGFVEASTENQRVAKEFIQRLMDRGLKTEQEILFIIDGSKGLYQGIKASLAEKALIQRCQWHKRENVVSYLSKEQARRFRQKLQAAYQQPSYEKAKQALERIAKELRLINGSAVESLLEGWEETLTLHRLGLFEELGTSFKTTNCLENVNRQLERLTHRVSYWKNSDQPQRWTATVLLEVEPRLRKVKGFRHLKALRKAMNKEGHPKSDPAAA
jgi:putative transposase